MQATPEQAAICASGAHVLKIRAGAGTGKTTTLRGLAARYPRQRMLYLAFNKAIKEDAQSKFGSHVKAMTGHGLAFARVGRDYAAVPNKLLSGDLKPFHVLKEIRGSLSSIPPGLHNLYGGRVIETLKRFLVSAEDELDATHVSLAASPGEKKHFSPEAILKDAASLLDKMADLEHPLPIPHDGYLKLFQLEHPRLPYDTILLDEAQDTNPVLQAMVDEQAGRRVYVGDEHQAIYGFRGARNAMSLLQADETHLLTGSFRFGAAVAEVANALLAAKGEQTLRLRGLGPASTVGPVDPDQPHTFLARGNSALFGRAVQALHKSQSFAFVGPLYNYRFDLIEQTHSLSVGKAVTDPFLKAFEDFDQLEEYAKAMDDREIIGRCKLVTKYGSRLPGLVAQIQAQAGSYPGPGRPHVILASAHRAKGLEFDRVVMADDFADFYDENKNEWRNFALATPAEQEEVNLQYVAATRARTSLEVGAKLEKFLQHQRVLAQSALPAAPMRSP